MDRTTAYSLVEKYQQEMIDNNGVKLSVIDVLGDDIHKHNYGLLMTMIAGNLPCLVWTEASQFIATREYERKLKGDRAREAGADTERQQPV